MSQVTACDTIICRCLNVTESTVQDSIQVMGAECIQEVKSICGAGGGCMSCRSRIKRMIAEHFSNTMEKETR